MHSKCIPVKCIIQENLTAEEGTYCSVRYCRGSSYMYFCTHVWTARIRLVNVCIYCTVLCCIIILGLHVLVGGTSSAAGSRRTLHV